MAESIVNLWLPGLSGEPKETPHERNARHAELTKHVVRAGATLAFRALLSGVPMGTRITYPSPVEIDRPNSAAYRYHTLGGWTLAMAEDRSAFSNRISFATLAQDGRICVTNERASDCKVDWQGNLPMVQSVDGEAIMARPVPEALQAKDGSERGGLDIVAIAQSCTLFNETYNLGVNLDAIQEGLLPRSGQSVR